MSPRSSGGSATKRKRSDNENPLIITRSDFWLKDGNVVLQAEGTQFKVHQSILSIRSAIFSDMFSAPGPQPSGEPLVEDCPIVHLSETSSSALPMPVVATFLRMGNKYDIEILRADALKRLSYEIPSDFKSYTSCQCWTMVCKDQSVPCMNVDILNLVAEHGMRSAMQLARYRCCKLCSAADLFKTHCSNGGAEHSLSHQEAITCAAAYIPLTRLQGETILA